MKFKDAFDAARWMVENPEKELLADNHGVTSRYKFNNGTALCYDNLSNFWIRSIYWDKTTNWRTPDEETQVEKIAEKLSETVFQEELTKLINRFGLDSRMGIADYLLAQYVHNNLRDLNYIIGQKK